MRIDSCRKCGTELEVNKTHQLVVTIKLVELGPDAKDIHDIAVFASVTKENEFVF